MNDTRYYVRPTPSHLIRCVQFIESPVFYLLIAALNIYHTQYAFESQVSGRGYDPDDAIIELSPRPGEFVLREEDILDTIARRGAEIALVIFSGVQYYTGQYFPIETITRKGKEQVFGASFPSDSFRFIYRLSFRAAR
jgi:kynureninase